MVERQPVELDVAGSNPVRHPKLPVAFLDKPNHILYTSAVGERDKRGVPGDPYRILQQEARSLLFMAGVRSNPGFRDIDIVDALRRQAQRPPSKPWNQLSERFFELYRDNLILTLQEAGVELKEPVTEIPNIIEGMRTLLLKQ